MDNSVIHKTSNKCSFLSVNPYIYANTDNFTYTLNANNHDIRKEFHQIEYCVLSVYILVIAVSSYFEPLKTLSILNLTFLHSFPNSIFLT